MNEVRIRSSNAQEDQWKLLGQFSYPTNIRRHFHAHNLSVTEETVNYIAGCIRQSEAYFEAAQRSPLDISPLLLYYGATNLLSGAAGLRTGGRPPILHHGMSFHLPTGAKQRIADCEVKPIRSGDGALQNFTTVFAPGLVMTNGEKWNLEELLGSIPDLTHDYENCYQPALPFNIPVTPFKEEMHGLEFLYDRVEMSFISKYPDHHAALMSIADHEKAYLTPRYNVPSRYVKLYYKSEHKNIGIYSIFGEKFLPLVHRKGNFNISVPQLLILCMGLFILGYISRYHPERWNPFVRSDDTGERLVLERFMSICLRYFPNLVLNEINGVRTQFVYEVDSVASL